MKIIAINLCLFVATSATTGIWTSAQLRAQEPVRRTVTIREAQQVVLPPVVSQDLAVRPNPQFPADPFFAGTRTSTSRAGSGAIRKAAEAVRDAKGDDAKSAAQKQLTDLLSKSYDEDMAQRERELKQIEERLAKLRELLSRRRSKKQDIVDLQVKVALNDADGLGFYDHEASSKTTANPYFYYSAPPVPRPVGPPTPAPSVNSSSAVPSIIAPAAPADIFVDPAPTAGPDPTPSVIPR
jgi:hypothetical protein